MKARGTILDLPHATVPDLKVPGFAVKLSDTPADVRYTPPPLGQHTHEILRDELGYAEELI